ncbi:hypothetical protein [Mariniluteicoccus flavus]
MRTAYRSLAYVICALVAVQAAMHAWSSAGLIKFLGGGGTLDMGAAAPPPVPEFAGVIAHAMIGTYVIPLVAVALVVVAFLARASGAVRGAIMVLVLVVVQVLLGFLGHTLTVLALLHGLNALALFSVAFVAARAMAYAPETVPTHAAPALV